MTFKTKIEFAEYRKLIFYLTYRKISVIIITITGTLLLVFTLLQFTHLIDGESDYLSNLIFGCILLLLMPLSILRASKKNFFSNARIQEPIEYSFTDDKMFINGESFKSEFDLSKIYKVKEIKSWFLVYQSKQTANLIPKSDLTSEQVMQLRYILDNVKTR